MKKINHFQAYQLLTQSEGRIFSAKFIKKDNTVRNMVGRLHVKKGVTGEGMKFDPFEKGLLGVFDMQKNAFRMVNINTLIGVKLDGNEYAVN